MIPVHRSQRSYWARSWRRHGTLCLPGLWGSCTHLLAGEGTDPCGGHAHYASVFINDDEYGLHQDYEVWLEGLAPHAPIDQYWHNRTGEACPEGT